MCCNQTHGPRRLRIRLRGRPRPSHELRLAERIRNLPPPRSSVHGRYRGYAGSPRTYQGSPVLYAGSLPSCQEGEGRVLEGL